MSARPHQERERLPNRREAELIDLEYAGQRWTASFGRFDDGRLAEIFVHSEKESELLVLGQEGAIIASLALQFGCPLEILRHALAGRDTGPIAHALALVERGARQ
jgi:hypothetical protein